MLRAGNSPLLGRGFPDPPPPLVASGWRIPMPLPFLHYRARPPHAQHHRYWLIIGFRSYRAARVLRPRCPCRAPAPGVLPGAPSRTLLASLSLRSAERYRPTAVFFVGWRFVLRGAWSMVSLCRQRAIVCPCSKRPECSLAGVLLAGAHAARTPLFCCSRGRCPRKPLPAERARGRGVFHGMSSAGAPNATPFRVAALRAPMRQKTANSRPPAVK